MKNIMGKEEPAYLVQDKKSGKTYITYESYAKKLERSGEMKISKKEGEKDFDIMKVKTERRR